MRLAVSILAALAASAAAGAARPPVALIASPAHLALGAGARGTVVVTNTGSDTAVVDVSRAAFALDLRGAPRVVGRRRAWVSVRPRRLSLAPGASAPVTVRALLPSGAEPGDHPALVLLTSRPSAEGSVAVRVRLGVVVSVRVPGRVVRRLAVLRVRAVAGRRLELLVANRGNVTERLVPRCLTLDFRRGARRLARLRPRVRELLPRAAGLFVVRYPGRVHGPITVRVWPAGPGCAPGLRRAFDVTV